ncbi:MAG: methyltransferase domain-containing protein [Steroidobacteraceae bacterium]
MPTPVRNCRFCNHPLSRTFIDLGMSPLCQTHITAEQLQAMEPFYPLHVYLCEACLLVQLQQFVDPPEIFGEYAYFSSYSDSWVEHARRYSELMRSRFDLGPGSQVIEIASNDGYLLRHFADHGIPCLGVEPAANVAQAAARMGIATIVKFFGRDTARELAANHPRPDLLIGNNVLAHVPDLNDFVCALQLLLKDTGVITLEFPHLQRLMQFNQFDTIYHEHFSYFSFLAVERVLAAHELEIFDVEELSTHGGSLRIYAHHARDRSHALSARVAALRQQERADGLGRIDTYLAFGEQVQRTKHALLEFLIEAKRSHKRIVGYGAPGKGNTLLNYCGIRTDFVDFTVDRNPYKQGKYTPGTHIPIRAPQELLAARPDYVLILPWNLQEEIMQQLHAIRAWGGRFVVPIPMVRVL